MFRYVSYENKSNIKTKFMENLERATIFGVISASECHIEHTTS